MQIEPYAYSGVPTQVQPQAIPLTYYTSSYGDRDELSLSRLIAIVRRRMWLIAGVTVAVTGAIWAWTLTRSPVYQSSFQVLVEPVINLNRPNEALLFGPQSNFDYATQIQVLLSPELLKPTVEKLQKIYPTLSHGELVGNLEITQVEDKSGRNTKILLISYKSQDPKKVKTVLDQLASDYIAYSVQLRQINLQQGVKFVEEKLPELKSRVDSLQGQLEKFRQRYSVVDPESRGSQIVTQLSNIESLRKDAQTQLEQQKTLYTTLQQQLNAYVPGGAMAQDAIAASALASSPRYQAALAEYQKLESQIAQELARFQPDSPNVQALRDRQQQLLPILGDEAQRNFVAIAPSSSWNLTGVPLDLTKQMVDAANQVQVLQARIQSLADTENRLKQEFSLVPSISRQYTDLQRELTVATESLKRFLETRENLQIEAAQRTIPWQVLIPAGFPGGPISPNIPRNLMLGLVAGLVLGMGAALMAEKLDNVFHSPADLKETTRLPLLAIIPYQTETPEIASPQGVPSLAANASRPRIALEDSQSSPSSATTSESGGIVQRASYYNVSPFSDAFRSLYANIRFLGSDEPIRSLVIGSAVPADGKSTVAMNLAQAAAAMGQRVLLVDADLRRPQIHAMLNLPNLRGLSNVISSDADPLELIQVSPLDENLSLLTSGPIPPDPTKLLSSKKMHHLMELFKEHFDLVIYDTPPLLGLADSSLLASNTDGLVLVVGLGRTDRSAFAQAIESLRPSGTAVLGIVANGIKGYTTDTCYQSYYQRYYNQRVPAEQQLQEEG